MLPSEKESTVKDIFTYDGNLDEAFAGQAVTIRLEDEIDISRGDVIVLHEAQVAFSNRMKAHLVWMSENVMKPGKQYLFKFASKSVAGGFDSIEHKIDVNTFETSEADEVHLNDISVVSLNLEQNVVVDPYISNRATGAFIVVDRLTNITVGAGMIDETLTGGDVHTSDFSEFELELNALIRKHFPHWDAKDIRTLGQKN